jgi:hypothetical protein
MARTTLTAKTAVGSYASYAAANVADFTMTAADVANKNDVVAAGKQLIFAHNTGASERTITITSSADQYGRTGDVTAYAIQAGEYAVFGPFELSGWVQTDNKMYFESNNAEVKFGVLNLPG